ncbi:uncharacterized protein PV09_04469 [Verruconis gallopava]|uniref:AB hydrolase-1 domain-containing protein n=1 Tax=Verruconis gallopava TaxID=253628 RepID=A0A0D2AE48_9PEZI|nr:uncharacterized protein PV09_04469 [Verruconis gallopava]KIW04740.1 hypothetical protein PV09_04469 [Verruconis gallopava]
MAEGAVTKPAASDQDGDLSYTITLPDGRKLGYAVYGSPEGKPILLHHGLAGSRLDGAAFHGLGKELNARIIGIDRPGMGLSTAQPNRTLLGFAKDVEHLTNYLKLDKYAVMGISGGGPSTLACAKALPATQLKAVAVVVGLGPPDIGMSGARIINRIGFPYGFRYCPSFLNRWFWRRDAIGRVDLTDEERLHMVLDATEKAKGTMPAKDVAVTSDVNFHRTYLRSTREAFAQGYDGVLTDAKLCCRPFGFRLEDFGDDLPIHLWYGRQDVFVPPIHGVEMAKRLGSRATLRLEDETHISLPTNYGREILEALLKTM